ncbi:MAG: symmetrical bis(5'-nucleosyl)-tetraphosphatase [Proteobacteria bacterium]|nr:symmetrical bis(5'-nucleosyl)-tetraphosphatase [Pseudomonadota bacterium]
MSTYVFGDVQGCFDELQNLLDRVGYQSGQDHLWFAGDLINRGPRNVEVMDLVMSEPNVKCVLGNHDLHFLAIATGQQTLKRSDTIEDLLNSPRLDEYINYLRHLPVLYYADAENLALVHAGIPPQMDINTCLALAGEVEAILQSDQHPDFFAAMYGNEPSRWNNELAGMDRLRIITNYFTRMRYCTRDGELELTHKTDIQPDGFAPWFTFERSDRLQVLFGHWAALNGHTGVDFAIPLDTGCVWGRELTAMRLEDKTFFSVEAQS